jgi:hypothetical protein
MEAIFRIHTSEFDEKLFLNIKKMFEGKPITIIITTELDETGYLSVNPANRKHLMENIACEPTISFTPEEFDKHVEELIKKS